MRLAFAVVRKEVGRCGTTAFGIVAWSLLVCVRGLEAGGSNATSKKAVHMDPDFGVRGSLWQSIVTRSLCKGWRQG